MEGSLQPPNLESLQTIDFLPLPSLRFGGVCSPVVVKERLKIVPAAPVADHHRINVGAAELSCPRHFNPGLGFLPVATRTVNEQLTTALSFNPGLGFLPVATSSSVFLAVSSMNGFNPSLGFLPVATWTAICPAARSLAFQSRSGFSACCDIPVYQISERRQTFQSRSGFSACCDVRECSQRGRRRSFNPGLGFLPVATPRREF